MSGPLLETKLHIPRRRRTSIARRRLAALLDRSCEATLTLVAGPAGFGKTTLLADWSDHACDGRPAAWLSLDERDNDPSSFWAYVIASVRSVEPEVGGAALALLRSPQAPLRALESLLNDLQALRQPLVLVLDDYHVVQEPQIHQGMEFLLDHLPSQAHVVLATRADPPLPLARWRARGELVEIRAGELRFTPDEASQYLREAMGLVLSDEQIAALDQRTEGWIAALQLAALSLQGHSDAGAFIATFAGDDRYIVDYLVEEVLQRQPPLISRFLLQTSILTRLTGPLCDAVTGEGDGRATLELLDRQNLFVVPLDDRRRWYRYHHLFAEVLRARLLDEQPERARLLHRRASAWYAEHDEPAEAVEHALRGEDVVRAARLVERALPALRRDRQDAELRRWLEALPHELVRDSPSLTMGLVGARMAHGELAGVEAGLQDAERWLEVHGDTSTASDAALRTLPSSIAMYRAGQARIRGDAAGTIEHAQRAYRLSSDEDHLERGAAAALLGLAHWSSAQLDDAHRCYTDALVHLSHAGHLSDVLGCTLASADIEVARGRLDPAAALLERGLRAARSAPHVPRGTADMHVGLAALHVERDELAAAVQHLSAADALGEHAGLPQNAYRSRVVWAQVRQAQQDPVRALRLLEEAERRYDSDYSPDVRPVPALIARLRIAQGRTDEAQDWARACEITAEDELAYVHEFEHLTLARLLLAQARAGSRDAALVLDGLLPRLLQAAQEGHRPGSVLDVHVLQALLAQLRGDGPGARAALGAAVAQAQPQRYVRSLTEHGAPLLELLTTLSPRSAGGGYASRLRAALADRGDGRAGPRGPLLDRLSARELEVLQLLASDLDGPGIARHLVVSVHTVRTHTKSIYAKLGVNSRRSAVHRARQLELLSGSAVQLSASDVRTTP